jgi:hypothetical protein
MDPYLESPELWPDVHHELISQIRGTLNPKLRPHYVARVELRIYVSDEDDPGRQVLVPDVRVEAKKPSPKAKRRKNSQTVLIDEPVTVDLLVDEEIKEARIEILHLESQSLVTVIEILSPSNKVRGSQGRKSFMDKRREILGGPVHWVEIDLLRHGAPSVNRPRFLECDYRFLVSKGLDRSRARLWPRSVRQPLPVIAIPLREPDDDVALNLGDVFQKAYDNAAYDLSIDYDKEPDPPLKEEDQQWAHELLKSRRHRK